MPTRARRCCSALCGWCVARGVAVQGRRVGAAGHGLSRACVFCQHTAVAGPCLLAGGGRPVRGVPTVTPCVPAPPCVCRHSVCDTVQPLHQCTVCPRAHLPTHTAPCCLRPCAACLTLAARATRNSWATRVTSSRRARHRSRPQPSWRPPLSSCGMASWRGSTTACGWQTRELRA
jgi:hypothetical protein